MRIHTRPAFAITRKKKLSSRRIGAISPIPTKQGGKKGRRAGAGGTAERERRFYLGAVTHTGFSAGEQGGARFLANQRVSARVGPLFGID